MSANALNTFGAILSYAIDLESTMERYYAAAAAESAVMNTASHELFENNAAKAAKRRARLTAMRQENVTEMVLEPISGLNAADYDLVIGKPSTPKEALAEAIRLEERVQRFYTDAGPKLNVTEPRRAFQKLAQEAAGRLDELRAASK